MKKGRLYNRQEIELIAKSAIGKSINDILNEELITVEEDDGNKGGLGQLVEQYLYGIQTNNDSEPDFMPAGIELKVTPYKKLKNGLLSAKERLVLNIIDYDNEYKNDFKSSHFWFKNNTIQILWYLWESNKNNRELKITHEVLLELKNNKDLDQIEKDWNYIINKIKEGKAHELSEADTMYLGACTKGANKDSCRPQPNNYIQAKQRAFCFKNSYMTQLVRKYIGDYSDVEKILKNSEESFEHFVNNVVDKYKGKSQTELMNEFGIKSNSKRVNGMIISKMFNVSCRLDKTDEFQKANIVPKTIRIEENGQIKESLPFPAFKYTDLVKQDWEDCEFKELLETTKYMFFIFKKEKTDYIFKGIKLWNVPEIEIESSAMEVWKKTYNIVKSGNIVKEIDNGKRITNFPGKSFNGVFHVRPHAKNAIDTYELPVTDKYTKQKEYTKYSFWINNNYIEKLFEEFN